MAVVVLYSPAEVKTRQNRNSIDSGNVFFHTLTLPPPPTPSLRAKGGWGWGVGVTADVEINAPSSFRMQSC